MWIVLDSGPLGLLTNPNPSAPARSARAWADRHAEAGNRLVVPEIADYEIRRELLRAGRAEGVARLSALGAALGYLPLTTKAIRDAARLWAEARRSGLPTAHDAAIDGDVILAAQAQNLVAQGDEVVVATTNPEHIGRYVAAHRWSDI